MDAKHDQAPQTFRVRRAAKQIDVSKRFLERMIELGELPVVRFGPRCVRIRAEDLAAYVKRHLFVGPPSDPRKVIQSRVKEAAA
jgi:excisionase family DNA binding protein